MSISGAGSSLVAVIGPPGAGKTTVVTALAQSKGLPVFRLREAVIAYSDLLVNLPPSTDPLGWIGVQAVRRILRAAFLDGSIDAGVDAVLLDNFPGTAQQLYQLVEVAAIAGRHISILELRAEGSTVAVRVATRRICPVCSSDRHAPASVSVANPACCARCGALLARRDSDTPTRHALRLTRYRANVTEIIEYAEHLQIPHLAILADHPPHVVHRVTQQAFTRLTNPAWSNVRNTKGACHGHCTIHAYLSS